MCASTWKNAAAKNQRTSGWASTGAIDTRTSCAGSASLRSGRLHTLAATAARLSTVHSAKLPMPWAWNHAPAASTVTRKPAEPHSRTRP